MILLDQTIKMLTAAAIGITITTEGTNVPEGILKAALLMPLGIQFMMAPQFWTTSYELFNGSNQRIRGLRAQ